MFYQITLCRFISDEKVARDIEGYGFEARRLVLTGGKSAFPGYLFTDPQFDAFYHPVDGVLGALRHSNESLALVSAESLDIIQDHIFALHVKPATDVVFQHCFSADRALDFCDTPGTILCENLVNIHRRHRYAVTA